jgi:hypothetical protein
MSGLRGADDFDRELGARGYAGRHAAGQKPLEPPHSSFARPPFYHVSRRRSNPDSTPQTFQESRIFVGARGMGRIERFLQGKGRNAEEARG